MAEDETYEKRRRRVGLISTVLLAVAAVATAWSSYQAARWTAEYRKPSGKATTLRIDAVRAQGLSEAQTEVDVATFTQWLDARMLGRTDLENFYFRRFRAEFRPAVHAWLATKPFTNSKAPLTPFAMPQYKLAAAEEAKRLESEAQVLSAVGQQDVQHSTNYVLAVVLFAVSLLFAGLSTKLGSLRQQEALLAMGWVIFLSTAIWVASSPVSVSI
jgi:hypothetical protein